MQHSVLLPLGLLVAIAASADAGNVSIRANGVVSGNSLSVSPLAGQPSNSPVSVTFEVITPGTPWPSAPTDGTEYLIDPNTFTIDVNGAQLGMLSAAEVLVLIDGFPVSDRLHIDVGGLDNGLSMTFQVGFTGATFDSLDITEQFGFYDFATLTSFDWRISGTGVGAMFIDFSSVEILPSSLGTPFCFGDGSGLQCPCGNTGALGEGCANSSGSGGTLSAVGTGSVSADNAQFSVVGLPTNQPSLLFAGESNLGGGILFNDGIRCAGGNVKRLGILTTSASGAASWPTGLAAQAGWNAGDRRYFQVWYRDPVGPCATTSNTSNGIDITFEP